METKGDIAVLKIGGDKFEINSGAWSVESDAVKLAELLRDIEIADLIGYRVTEHLATIRTARKTGNITATLKDGSEHIIT